MTKRSEARNIGRNIRRVTGISFPVAMNMAKALVRDGVNMLKYNDRFSEFLDLRDTFGCGPECCGYNWEVDGIKGPKGTLDVDNIRNHTFSRAHLAGKHEKVRVIYVAVVTLDAALSALRGIGSAMIANPTPLAGYVTVAINVSGNKAHRALVAAGIKPPVSSRDRKIAPK